MWIGPIAAACAQAPATVEESPLTASQDLSLTWSVRSDGVGLLVDYTVENRGDHAVWLLDEPLVFAADAGVERAPGRIVVRAGEGGVVRLIRGYARPLSQPAIELPPAARPLPPGGRAVGHAVVPLPLSAWHPNDPTPRPIGAAATAVFELGVLDSDEDLDLRPLADGTEVLAPSPPRAGADQRVLRGEPRPLP